MEHVRCRMFQFLPLVANNQEYVSYDFEFAKDEWLDHVLEHANPLDSLQNDSKKI
jgi:hypothetical protein